jgi:hypothetical protein
VLTFSGDGRWLTGYESSGWSSGSGRQFVQRTWEVATGKELVLEETYNNGVFSPDGRYFLSTWHANQYAPSRVNVITRVWDSKTSQPAGAELPLGARGFDVAELGPGGRVALVPDTRTDSIRAFDVASGEVIQAFTVSPWSTDGTLPVRLTPDGRRVVVAGRHEDEPFVEVRDLKSGHLLARPIKGVTMAPGEGCFSPDGVLLVTHTGSLQLWELASGDPISPALPAERGPWADPPLFRWSSDGRTLFTHINTRPRGWPEHLTPWAIWEVRPDSRPLEELQTLARLHSGCTIEGGKERRLSLVQYRDLWRKARASHPGAFAPGAPAEPAGLPPLPAPPPAPVKKKRKEKWPEQRPDYRSVIRRRWQGVSHGQRLALEALQESDGGIRRSALTALEGMKPDPGLWLALQVEALRDDANRDDAVKRLGALGPAAREAVPGLHERLKLHLKYDDEPAQQTRMLAWALGRIGPDTAPAVPAIVEALRRNRYGNHDVPYAVVLARIGSAAGIGAPAILEKFARHGRHGANRQALIAALLKIAEGNPRAVVTALAEALSVPGAKRSLAGNLDHGERVRTAAADVLAALGARARAASPALRAVLDEPAPYGIPGEVLLRPAVVEAIMRVENNPAFGVPLLASLVAGWIGQHATGSPTWRGRAAVALGRLGPAGRPGLEVIRKRWKRSSSLWERLDCAEALWRLESSATEIVPFLAGVVKEGEAGNRKHEAVRAAEVLELIGPAARDAVPALLAAIRAEDAKNAHSSFRIISRPMDDEGHEVPYDRWIREAGLKALWRIEPQAARTIEQKQ